MILSSYLIHVGGQQLNIQYNLTNLNLLKFTTDKYIIVN